MVFRFWVSGEKDKLRERGSCGEIESDLGVTVRENRERESGSRPEIVGRRKNGDSRGCGCHRRDFEDLGHVCPPVSLSLSLYSFSLQIHFEIGSLFFFFFFSF